MLEEPHRRIVEPLDLPNLPNLGKEIVADLESGKIKFPDPILKAIAKSDNEKGYKEIGERFGKMINRFWFWKELKTKYSNLVPYSFRHSFAWRGSMETVPAIPYRVLADLLGHDLDTHLKYYGKWSNNAENKKRIEEANKNNAEKYDKEYSKERQEIRKYIREDDRKTKAQGGTIDWGYLLNAADGW